MLRKYLRAALAATLLILIPVAVVGCPQENGSVDDNGTIVPVEGDETTALSIADVVKLLEPAVVRIETPEGSGSGFIISRAGYVLTNNHVVSGFTIVKITLIDGQEYDGVVLRTNEDRDLALVALINAPLDIVNANLGVSNEITIGEEVVAIGYALGLEGQVSFSAGIISATRDLDGYEYIQTDAAINPGNSGGPLVNLKGEVIGINSAKYVGVAVEGIGLAIPIDETKEFIDF